MRSLVAGLVFLSLVVPSVVRADWPAAGLRLNPTWVRSYSAVRLVPDGPGRFVTYLDGRSNTYLYKGAQHAAFDGSTTSGWADWEGSWPYSDGGNGFFVGSAFMSTYPSFSIFRMSAGANAPPWPAAGVPVDSMSASEHVAAPDSAGGAYVLWANGVAFLRRYGPDGALLPGWSGAGLSFAGSALGLPSGSPQLLVDASGRAVVMTLDVGNTIRTLRVLHDGTLDPGWTASALVSAPPAAPVVVRLLADGDGYFALWGDAATHVARLGADGTVQPGWPVIALATSDWAGAEPGHLVAFPDGAGGVFVFCNPGTQDGNLAAPVYATHLLADGSAAPGWSRPGAALAPPGTGPLSLKSFIAGPDSLGGAFFGWDGKLTRLAGDHALASGWAASGDVVTAPGAQVYGSCASGVTIMSVDAVVGDGTGAALVVLSLGDNCSYPYQALRMVRFTPAGLAGVGAGAPSPAPGVKLLGANPAAGPRRFSLTADDSAPAVFEILDVTGRIVSREPVAAGAARECSWSPRATSRPGVYFARLTQRGAWRTARFVVLQ